MPQTAKRSYNGLDQHDGLSQRRSGYYDHYLSGGGCTVAGALTANTATVTGTLKTNSGTVYGAHTLYDNSSGTTGTITLSSSLANYTYVDIMYAKLDSGSGGYNVCRVYSPNGKRASFNQINPVSSSAVFQVVFSKIVMSGTSITWDATGCYINIGAPTSNGTGSIGSIHWAEAKQLIYKIIGYK